MYGRYEFKDSRSDKFWQISLLDSGKVLAAWGKNGRPPQGTTTYTQAEARTKVGEKIGKGYRQVRDFSGLPKAAPAPTAKTTKASKAPKAAKSSGSVPAGVVQPSRCTASLPDDLEQPHLVAEEKIDGSRYVLYFGYDPYGRQSNHTLLSRRVSVVDGKHVDRTENIPHITSLPYKNLRGTVLDGEVQAQDMDSTNSIMNSSPALAVEKQKKMGLCTYHVFDIMFHKGKDVRDLPLSDRRKILISVVKEMNNPNVQVLRQVTGNFLEFFKAVVGKRGEGIVIKDLRKGYGIGWAKMKKVYDVSCIITGFKPGKGKYATSLGSLALSVYYNGSLVEIAFASGFDDKTRFDMEKNFKKYKGKVVDVFAQEMTKPSGGKPCGRIRHATFHRFRDDFNESECTFEKLVKDMKAANKTKTRRQKED